MSRESEQQGRSTAIRAWRAVEKASAPGDGIYDRGRHLPRLLPVGPDELADATPRGRLKLLCRLARALRAERTRGRAGHWTYDLNRHLGLIEAYRAERAACGRGGAARRGTGPDV